jgi:hypothetical protein
MADSQDVAQCAACADGPNAKTKHVCKDFYTPYFPVAEPPAADWSGGKIVHSAQIGEFALALSVAQGLIENASKDARNPHFGSRYADLASIWNACRAALSASSIAVLQVPYLEGDLMLLDTMLVHKSGQWFRGTYPVRPVKPDPQGFGSALTYARRYSLASMVGVAPDDDDAEEHAAAPPSKWTGPAAAPKPTTAAQIMELAEQATTTMSLQWIINTKIRPASDEIKDKVRDFVVDKMRALKEREDANPSEASKANAEALAEKANDPAPKKKSKKSKLLEKAEDAQKSFVDPGPCTISDGCLKSAGHTAPCLFPADPPDAH